MSNVRRSSPGSPPNAGTFLGPYKILDLIGAGGMGEVYRALDPRLGREVAIKLLPRASATDPASIQRFEREARAVAALSHPNILSIHEFGRCDDGVYAVMELLEGATLRAILAEGAIPLRRAVGYAIQIAQGLSAAHRRGIIHRDLKPENLFVTKDGLVKILDFGLAKLRDPEDGVDADAQTASAVTGEGTVLGTVGYMAPEQVRGKPVDVRTDVFSFGAVLYEMLSGTRAFKGTTAADTLMAILTLEPPEFADSGKSIPPAVDRIVRRCLEKGQHERFHSAQDVAFALEETTTADGRTGGRQAWLPRAGKRRVIAIGLAAVLIGGVAFLFFARRTHRAGNDEGAITRDAASRERWVLETAIPEVGRLVEDGDLVKAAPLLREARAILPNDPTLAKLWVRTTIPVSVDTRPAGATVSVQPYPGESGGWEALGQTPFKDVRVTRNVYVLRVAKPGFATASFIDGFDVPTRPSSADKIGWSLKLRPAANVPPGMLTVSGDEIALDYPVSEAPPVEIDDFLIDRHEVTNEEYKTFVDAGGYQATRYWKVPFVRDGRTVPWREALAEFHDATGRSGPSTWEVGTYPRGREKHPVAGVSWYEAAAYAEFAGKSLPTVYHWMDASQADGFTEIIAPGSNFRGEGTQPVGGHGTLSGHGTMDMAGNAKEWCWNEGRDGKRFTMGGGFGEPLYNFQFTDAQSPWRRGVNFGFRCVRLDSPPPPLAAARIAVTSREYLKEKPASDAVFKAYRGLYAYDKAALNARVDETETTELWTRQRVSFDAAYGGERMIADVFLPRNAAPPYQVVAVFPAATGFFRPTLMASDIDYALDFIFKSGRGLVFPIYKGMYERRDGLKAGGKPPGVFRDHVIMMSKDLGRSLDYLQTRADIDSAKVAYLGFSFGGSVAPVMLGVEKRFKAAILSSGGVQLRHDLPEADPLNFLGHVTIPVLMLNGRYDEDFPLESSQIPFFRLLGTPARDKKHVIYETGTAISRTEKRSARPWTGSTSIWGRSAAKDPSVFAAFRRALIASVEKGQDEGADRDGVAVRQLRQTSDPSALDERAVPALQVLDGRLAGGDDDLRMMP
jgi:predicted esterase